MLIEAERVMEVVRFAAGTDTIVVVDEAYFPFSRSSVIEAVSTHPNLTVVRTFSKAYGLAGARLGFVVGAGALVKALYKVRASYDINSFVLLCADYLLDHYDIVDDYVGQVRRSAELLRALARKHDLEAPETATNFQLVKTAPRFDPGEVSDRVRQTGYVIRGPVDGGVMKDYIRVTLGEFDVIRRFGDSLDSVFKTMGIGRGTNPSMMGASGVSGFSRGSDGR
jgi:histidinol-phosphate aminotransferase